MTTKAYLTFKGVVIPIEVHANETVAELKSRISTGLWTKSDFIFKGKEIKDQDPALSIPNNATIQIILREEPKNFQIFARPLTFELYELSVTPYDTVVAVKKQVIQKLGNINYPPKKLKLLLGAAIRLQNESFIGDYYQIKKETILNIGFRLRGIDMDWLHGVYYNGKGPGRGGYINIPLVKKAESEISDLAELSANLSQFVQIYESDREISDDDKFIMTESDRAPEGQFTVYEERGYYHIRWVPKDTIHSTLYYMNFCQGKGSEYLTATHWTWGDFYQWTDAPEVPEEERWSLQSATMEELFAESNLHTGKLSFVKKDTMYQVTDARTNETRPVVALFNGPESRTPLAVLKRHIAVCFDDVAANEIVELKVGEMELKDDSDVLALKKRDVIRFSTKKE